MYDKQINHNNRTAFVIAVDCSTSMREMITFNSQYMSKADAVALVCNYMIDELMSRATRSEGVRDYYDIAVIGYSGEGVRSLLPSAESGFISIRNLAHFKPEPEQYSYTLCAPNTPNTSVSITLHPWIKATAVGSTPMYEALIYIREMVEKWCNNRDNHNSFPPMVFNITDGECSDGSSEDLIREAERITELKTTNGNVLLMNIHLSTYQSERCEAMPSNYRFTTQCPYKSTLFHMSSILPQNMEPLIAELIGSRFDGPYRCVAFNASMNELLMILNIGSHSISDQ